MIGRAFGKITLSIVTNSLDMKEKWTIEHSYLVFELNIEVPMSKGPNLIDMDEGDPVLSICPDPLPQELLFDGVEDFIIPIPFVCYVTGKYMQNQLLPHYNTTLETVDKVIEETKASLIKAENHLKEVESRNLNPAASTKTYTNSDYWRIRVFTYIKESKHQKKLSLSKINDCNELLELLKKIRAIVEEVIKHPRMIGFAQSYIARLQKIRVREAHFPDVYKVKALSAYVADTKSVLNFLPRPFADQNTASEYIKRLLAAAKRYKDPMVQFLRESDESYQFVDFIRCKISPLKKIPRFFDIKLKPRIRLSINNIIQFVGIDDPSLVTICAEMTCRYWWNRVNKFDDYINRSNSQLPIYLRKLREKKVSEFKPPKSLSKIINFNETPKEVIQNVNLAPAVDVYFYCLFLTNVCDIAAQINLIHLRFAGLIATTEKCDLTHKKIIPGVEFLWKMLLIAIDMPAVESVLLFIDKWRTFEYLPKKVFENTEIPINIMKKFYSELRPKAKFGAKK